MKRRGNRRYYQHHEVLLVRRIRELLYDQGFTISGARNRLGEVLHNGRGSPREPPPAVMEALETPVDVSLMEIAEGDLRASDQGGPEQGLLAPCCADAHARSCPPAKRRRVLDPPEPRLRALL